MSVEKTEEVFVNSFIRKSRRDRSLWALGSKKKRSEFIDKFNHNWTDMITETNLIPLNTISDTETFAKIKSVLHFKNSELCYVISHTNSDGSYMNFEDAFMSCQASMFACLIINKEGTKFYLKTEQEISSPKTFIGIK